MPALFGLPGGAGVVAGGDLIGGHGRREPGPEFLVAGGPVLLGPNRSDLLGSLGGRGLVGPDDGLVVQVTDADLALVAGGGPVAEGIPSAPPRLAACYSLHGPEG